MSVCSNGWRIVNLRDQRPTSTILHSNRKCGKKTKVSLPRSRRRPQVVANEIFGAAKIYRASSICCLMCRSYILQQKWHRNEDVLFSWTGFLTVSRTNILHTFMMGLGTVSLWCSEWGLQWTFWSSTLNCWIYMEREWRYIKYWFDIWQKYPENLLKFIV